MLEVGARFANDFYVKVGIDPEDETNNFVLVETVTEGNPTTVTGTITWDDGE